MFTRISVNIKETIYFLTHEIIYEKIYGQFMKIYVAPQALFILNINDHK